MLDHVLDYAAAGWLLFPVDPKSKAPLRSTGADVGAQLDATADEAILTDWWTRYPDALIGCRVPPGTVVLDIDPRHDGDKVWVALREAMGGDFPVTRTSASGRGDGGGHVWFKWDDELGVPSVKSLTTWAIEKGLAHTLPSGKPSCGIDVLRWMWRFTILPPSMHPETLQPYTWVGGRGPDHPVAPMPALLQALLIAPTAPAAAERAEVQADSPADWFSANGRWQDVLGPHGWTCVHGDGDGDGSLWRHPLATTDHSASVTDGILFVYSTSTVFEPTETGDTHGYTRFRAHAMLNFRGDQAAAARDVRLRLMPARVAPTGTSHDDLRPSGLAAFTGYDEAVRADREAGEAEDDWDDSFNPIDLGPYLDGTHEQPMPKVLRRADGEHLFYRGVINGIHGDSGSGKSWVVLQAIMDEAEKGRRTLYLDFEDTPTSITSRLLLLGMTAEAILEHVIYLRPQVNIGPRGLARLQQLIVEFDVTLVAIDSLGEAFGLEGISENDDDEVGPWLRLIARPLADTVTVDGEGPAVVLIDHITKANENPLHPSGSKRKRAAVGGAQYYAEAIRPFVKDEGGLLRLTCAKDRHGNYERGKPVAELEMVCTDLPGPSTRLFLRVPTSVEVIKERKVTSDMQRVITIVEAEGRPMSRRQVLAAIREADPNGKGFGDDRAKGALELAAERHLLRYTPAGYIPNTTLEGTTE